MPSERPLSALELTVMGVVWKRSPCTGYAVIQEFTGSASAYYRSGAGSIYPLLKRLHQSGILTADQEGGETRYGLSAQGLAALQSWVRHPVADEDYACNLDRLRSRMYFLRALPATDWEAAVLEWREGLRLLATRCEADLEGYRALGDAMSELAMEGALAETRARLAWLDQILPRIREEASRA